MLRLSHFLLLQFSQPSLGIIVRVSDGSKYSRDFNSEKNFFLKKRNTLHKAIKFNGALKSNPTNELLTGVQFSNLIKWFPQSPFKQLQI
ncbi:hypothetical protein FGO68_gene17037 [Halteria grandinella]|uniref:Secreted protein n=1 Tax=Halteria grandinella TaxID=5974 RepID=A0A8J8SWT8_HALGN|nr:hypothetical protein FGO68_gene17037 [Halteria grandinella]